MKILYQILLNYPTYWHWLRHTEIHFRTGNITKLYKHRQNHWNL